MASQGKGQQHSRWRCNKLRTPAGDSAWWLDERTKRLIEHGLQLEEAWLVTVAHEPGVPQRLTRHTVSGALRGLPTQALNNGINQQERVSQDWQRGDICCWQSSCMALLASLLTASVA